MGHVVADHVPTSETPCAVASSHVALFYRNSIIKRVILIPDMYGRVVRVSKNKNVITMSMPLIKIARSNIMCHYAPLSQNAEPPPAALLPSPPKPGISSISTLQYQK